MAINRRLFLQMAGAAAVLPIGGAKQAAALTSELVGILNQGDILRVEHPNVFIDRVAPPPPASVTFVYMTDVHTGKPNTYDQGELQTIITYVLGEHAPAFVVVNGDLSDDGTTGQINEYMALWGEAAVFHLPGNHDENLAYDDPPPNNYDNYDWLVGSRQWAFTTGGYRLIGFTSQLKRDNPFQGFGWLDAGTKAFLDNEAANLNGLKPILFSHFPLHDGFGNNIRDYQGAGQQSGQRNIFDLFAASNGGLYFSGHRHIGFVRHDSQVVPGLVELQGPCLAYDQGNPDGGFLVVSLSAEAVTIGRYLGRSPHTLLEEIEI